MSPGPFVVGPFCRGPLCPGPYVEALLVGLFCRRFHPTHMLHYQPFHFHSISSLSIFNQISSGDEILFLCTIFAVAHNNNIVAEIYTFDFHLFRFQHQSILYCLQKLVPIHIQIYSIFLAVWRRRRMERLYKVKLKVR
jgi:hypothetical protein